MQTSKASLTPRSKLASSNITDLTIERGIPIPTETRGRPSIWPFASMKIGDSFFLAGDSVKCQRTLASASTYYHRRHGMVFVTRKVDGGARIWRVEDPDAKGSSK